MDRSTTIAANTVLQPNNATSAAARAAAYVPSFDESILVVTLVATLGFHFMPLRVPRTPGHMIAD
eukprot:3456613-Lingulodinium_polyedra.AAC.1